MAGVAVDDMVGSAAGLEAVAAVGGAAEQVLGHETAAGYGNAQGAVDENLDLEGGVLFDFFNLIQG